MAKGIYSSGLSCWQRRVAKLPQDNAGPEPIEKKVEEEKPVVKKTKKVANSTKDL